MQTSKKYYLYFCRGISTLNDFYRKNHPDSRNNKIMDTFFSMGSLASTLLVNLLSHYLSSYFHEKTTEEFDTNCKHLNENIDFRNKIMRGINIGTVSSLFIGISFLILFLSLNLHSMKVEKNNLITTKPDTTIREERGATIIKPASTNKPKEEVSDNNSDQDSSKTNNSESNGKDN